VWLSVGSTVAASSQNCGYRTILTPLGTAAKFATVATETVVVSSAEDFRAYADEHLGWAKTARTDRERNILLQMAKAWIEAADGRLPVTESSQTGSPPDHQNCG
jgi:hypothetical protein